MQRISSRSPRMTSGSYHPIITATNCGSHVRFVASPSSLPLMPGMNTLQMRAFHLTQQSLARGGRGKGGKIFPRLNAVANAPIGVVPQLPRRFVVLDAETTGLLPTKGDSLIEVFAMEVIDGEPTGREFYSKVGRSPMSIPTHPSISSSPLPQSTASERGPSCTMRRPKHTSTRKNGSVMASNTTEAIDRNQREQKWLAQQLERRLKAHEKRQRLLKLINASKHMQRSRVDPTSAVTSVDGTIQINEPNDKGSVTTGYFPRSVSSSEGAKSALKVHGLSEESLIGEPPIEIVLPKLLRFIRGSKQHTNAENKPGANHEQRPVVCGHCVSFDVAMIEMEAFRLGLYPLPQEASEQHHFSSTDRVPSKIGPSKELLEIYFSDEYADVLPLQWCCTNEMYQGLVQQLIAQEVERLACHQDEKELREITFGGPSSFSMEPWGPVHVEGESLYQLVSTFTPGLFSEINEKYYSQTSFPSHNENLDGVLTLPTRREVLSSSSAHANTAYHDNNSAAYPSTAQQQQKNSVQRILNEALQELSSHSKRFISLKRLSNCLKVSFNENDAHGARYDTQKTFQCWQRLVNTPIRESHFFSGDGEASVRRNFVVPRVVNADPNELVHAVRQLIIGKCRGLSLKDEESTALSTTNTSSNSSTTNQEKLSIVVGDENLKRQHQIVFNAESGHSLCCDGNMNEDQKKLDCGKHGFISKAENVTTIVSRKDDRQSFASSIKAVTDFLRHRKVQKQRARINQKLDATHQSDCSVTESGNVNRQRGGRTRQAESEKNRWVTQAQSSEATWARSGTDVAATLADEMLSER